MKKKTSQEKDNLEEKDLKEQVATLLGQNQNLVEMANLRDDPYFRLMLLNHLGRIASSLQKLESEFVNYLNSSEEEEEEEESEAEDESD